MRAFRPTIAVLIAASVAFMFSSAKADFESALDAHKRGDYTAALGEFRRLATQGDPSAQFWLGVMYDNGDGVPQNQSDRVPSVKHKICSQKFTSNCYSTCACQAWFASTTAGERNGCG